MKTGIALALLLCLSTPGLSGEYESALGFRCELPDSWVVVNRDSLDANPDFLLGEPPFLEAMPASYRNSVLTAISVGICELFFDMDGVYGLSRPRLNVVFEVGTVPGDSVEVAAERAAIEAAFPSAGARDTLSPRLLSYDQYELGGTLGTRMEYEIPLAGRRTTQYLIPAAEGRRVAITTGFDASDAEAAQAELSEFLASFSVVDGSPSPGKPGEGDAKPD